MKFLLDENVDYRLVSFLQKHQHDVTAIARDYLAGLSDEAVLEIAYTEQRILITNDRGDFGNLIFRYRLPHSGVILFRLKDEALPLVESRLLHVLTNYADQLHHFLVITPQRTRIRKSLVATAA